MATVGSAIVCDRLRLYGNRSLCDRLRSTICDPRTSAIVCDHMETSLDAHRFHLFQLLLHRGVQRVGHWACALEYRPHVIFKMYFGSYTFDSTQLGTENLSIAFL